MAELDFILQAVTTKNHAQAVRTLLGLANPTQVLISVAFVREAGIDAVEAAINPLVPNVKVFVGIRNDITSIQAVKRLLATKVELYAVDTGSRNILFHPKLYFAANANQATVIIGSANLTFGGLHNNIEVSSRVKLDLANAADKKFSEDITDAFAEMLKNHPKHVFLIKDATHADELFESGRLADEDLLPAPSIGSGVKKGERDDLPPMNLTRISHPRIKNGIAKRLAALKPAKLLTVPVAQSPLSLAKYLVWESKPLIRRDLCIPQRKSTHPTGSIGLKKGALDNINSRHYFRDQIFAHLAWTKDPSPKKAKWERAYEDFELVIKNLNYGVFKLKLSHNTDKKSATYAEKNFLTQLHWGDAKKYVAKQDLLGRTLYLYRKDATPPEFTIEID